MTVVSNIDQNAPAWLLEAQGFLAEKVKFIYEEKKQEDMPCCYGQILDFGNGENSYKVVPIPEEFENHEAYDCFRYVLGETLKSPDFGSMLLGGFTIIEGWELDPETKERTGRTKIISNIETPDGWSAVQSWDLENHTLTEDARLVEQKFGTGPRGRMQGMFPDGRQARTN